MKIPKLGDFLLWNKKPAKIIGTSDSFTVHIEMLENHKCPHCNGDLGKEQIAVIAASPMFQEMAEPLQTLYADSGKNETIIK